MTPAAPGAGGGAVEVTPATFDVTDLAPGAVVTQDVTVTNGSGVPVLVTVTHAESGALFTGASPLTLASAWITAGPACGDAPVVAPGARADLGLRVALPADAGNEYQGLAGAATITVRATELPGGVCPAPGGAPGTGGSPPGTGGPGTGSTGTAQAATPPDGALALTGAEAALLLPTIALLVVAGAALVRLPLGRRRPRPQLPGGEP